MALTSKTQDSQTTIAGIMEAPGAYFAGVKEIQLDNAYPTNGYSITPAILNLSRIRKFVPMCLGPSVSAAISDFSYDLANGKVKLYTSGAVELANNGDASALKLYAYVEGVL